MFQRILGSSQIPAINKFRNHEGLVLPGGSVIKNLLAMQVMQKTQVQSLGQEDPLVEEIATHSSILAREKSHGQRSLVGYSPQGCKELDMTERLNTHTHTHTHTHTRVQHTLRILEDFVPELFPISFHFCSQDIHIYSFVAQHAVVNFLHKRIVIVLFPAIGCFINPNGQLLYQLFQCLHLEDVLF